MRALYLATCLSVVLGLVAGVRDHATLRSALGTQGGMCAARPLDVGIGMESGELFELGRLPERPVEGPMDEYNTQKTGFERKFCEYLLQYGDKAKLHSHLANVANKLYTERSAGSSTRKDGEEAWDYDPTTDYFIGNLRDSSPNNKYSTPEFRGHNVEAAAKLFLGYGFTSGLLSDCTDSEMSATIGVANRVESCLEAAFQDQWSEGGFEVLDESMIKQITSVVGAMDCSPDGWLLQCAETDINRIQKLIKARARADYNAATDEFRCFREKISDFSSYFISDKSTRLTVNNSCIALVERHCHKEKDFGNLAFSICGEILKAWGEYDTPTKAFRKKSDIVAKALHNIQVAQAIE